MKNIKKFLISLLVLICSIGNCFTLSGCESPLLTPQNSTTDGVYYAYSYGIDVSTGKLYSVYDEHHYVRLREDGTLDYWYAYLGLKDSLQMWGYNGTYTVTKKNIDIDFYYIDPHKFNGETYYATGTLDDGVLSFYWCGDTNDYPTVFCKEGVTPDLKNLTVSFEHDGSQISTNTYSSLNSSVFVPEIQKKEGLFGEWEIKDCTTRDNKNFTLTVTSMYNSLGFNPNDWEISIYESDAYNNPTHFGFVYYGNDEIFEVPEVIRNVEINHLSYLSTRTNTEIKGIVIPKSIMSIEYCFVSNEIIYYKGSKSEWDLITLSYDGESLKSATKFYYVENQQDLPNDGDNYWHYNEKGEIVVW